MRLIPPAPVIGLEEGFTKENDLFGRKSVAQSLTNIIRSVEEPIVVAVDAQWGDGKTVFLQMWAGELRKLKIPVIRIDAYENDYIEDAFTAIAGEIIAIADERKKASSDDRKRFVETATETGKILLAAPSKSASRSARPACWNTRTSRAWLVI